MASDPRFVKRAIAVVRAAAVFAATSAAAVGSMSPAISFSRYVVASKCSAVFSAHFRTN